MTDEKPVILYLAYFLSDLNNNKSQSQEIKDLITLQKFTNQAISLF
jgi:hypothetical protein